MSLHEAAKHLKQHGRGPDDQLVHMTTGELKSLQGLAQAHGGSLTTNPHTGLPEAGFLSNLLPTVLGVAASAVFPEASPWLIGAGVGAADYAVTGSLGQGLMAGLGAYGGADLGGGLANMGAQDITTQAARDAVQNVNPADFATGTGSQAGVNSFDALNPGDSGAENLATAQQTAAQNVINQNPGADASWLNKMGSGINAAAANPMAYLGQNWKSLATVAGPALSGMKPNTVQNPAAAPYNGPLSKYHLASNFQGYTPAQPNPYYQAQGLGYAAGGIAAMAPGGGISDMHSGMFPQSQMDKTQFATSSQAPAQAMNADYDPRTNPQTGEESPIGMASGGMAPSYTPPDVGIFHDSDPTTSKQDALQAALTQMGRRNKNLGIATAALPKTNVPQLGQVNFSAADNMAAGGVAHGIGGYSDGGQMLKGPGDGMSDSIPATIGGKQPARLADGEFVVPADVVSHLGNGSTDAGAKRLYSMMDKIRKARTGNPKQGKKINPDKFMPT